MYATPMLFSRAASELSASGATASATIGAIAADLLAANTPLKGNAIPRNTAMITANTDADRMRIRIVISYSSLNDERWHCATAPTQLILAAFGMVVNGFHKRRRAVLDAPALRS